MADELGYHVKILRVKRGEDRNRLIVFYISERDYDDSAYFYRLAKGFGRKYRVRTELRHAKDMEGNYAMM